MKKKLFLTLAIVSFLMVPVFLLLFPQKQAVSVTIADSRVAYTVTLNDDDNLVQPEESDEMVTERMMAAPQTPESSLFVTVWDHVKELVSFLSGLVGIVMYIRERRKQHE